MVNVNNYVVSRIKGISNWIKSNPQVVEPNMHEFMEVLIEVSTLEGNNRKDALAAYADMYSARFGNPKCPNRTDTAMWKLFTAVFAEVKRNFYKVDNRIEAELLCMLMGIGNYCHQQKEVHKMYDNHTEFAKLCDYKEQYVNSENPKFELLVEAAFHEIQECYQK